MNGVLLIDKPAGWTSFDVVNKVRRMAEGAGLNATGKKRFPVGHTGTLDPLATGLLVLMCGAYTKKVPEYTKLDKTYEVTMLLGQTSTTGDEEGEKVAVSDRRPLLDEVRTALESFVGDIMQTPPAFSAIKVNGQRAYKLARKGEAPKLEARPVHVERITLNSYEYPEVHFTAHVSSGTYIRSLVEDVGAKLGTGAYMSALRRTQVGSFKLAAALTMDNLTPEALQQTVRPL
jgi:tRNA pseudouridine55 synthase